MKNDKELNKDNIVFIGGGMRAIPLFKQIIERGDYRIELALFNKSHPHETRSEEELARIAREQNIEYRVAEKIDKEIIDKTARISPLVIVGGGIWRTYIPESFFNCGRYGLFGAHGSLLPAYKGFCGINWYMINGEKEYGLQMFRLGKRIDSGELVCRKKNNTLLNRTIPIKDEYMINDLLGETIKANADIWMEFLDLIRNDEICLKKQDVSEETWTCHRGPEDARIDWNQDTRTVYNFIRAQSYPYPGAFSYLNGERFYIWKVRLPENPPKYIGVISGKVVKVDAVKGSIWVLTANGIIEVLEVSKETDKSGIKPAAQLIKSVKERFC